MCVLVLFSVCIILWLCNSMFIRTETADLEVELENSALAENNLFFVGLLRSLQHESLYMHPFRF